MESHGLILAIIFPTVGVAGDLKLNKAPRMQTGLPDERRAVLISLVPYVLD
jgi:hypothetical protein